MTLVLDNIEKWDILNESTAKKTAGQSTFNYQTGSRNYLIEFFVIHAENISKFMSVLSPDEQKTFKRTFEKTREGCIGYIV
jgi:hypothetical protein